MSDLNSLIVFAQLSMRKGFRVGELEDSSLVARRILTYRRQLVASPDYLQKYKPKTPGDLRDTSDWPRLFEGLGRAEPLW